MRFKVETDLQIQFDQEQIPIQTVFKTEALLLPGLILLVLILPEMKVILLQDQALLVTQAVEDPQAVEVAEEEVAEDKLSQLCFKKTLTLVSQK